MSAAGSCFGAAVASSVELEFLRLGGGDSRLTVEQLPAAAPLPAGAPLIAFSVSGYARSVIDAVQVAQQYGATTIAITPPDSALAKVADTVIHFQSLEDGNIYKPTSSRYALLSIVDMIVTSVAETRGPRVLENLRRIKQSVNTLKVDDPRLPLGD